MPKIKTVSGAAKRFSLTATGKVKRAKAYKRHILNHKTTKQKRKLRQGTYVAKCDAKGVKKMIPHA